MSSVEFGRALRMIRTSDQPETTLMSGFQLGLDLDARSARSDEDLPVEPPWERRALSESSHRRDDN